MPNHLIRLSYVGTAYHGFQIQANADTVQARLQTALRTALGFLPDIKGCSRTDSGVHARAFYVSFCTPQPLDARRFLRSVNALLPDDIRVHAIEQVPETFHARYSAASKVYEYLIYNSPVMDPFLNGRAVLFPGPFDCEAVNRALAPLLGRHDFSAFCGEKGKKEDMCRTLTRCAAAREGDLVRLTAAADGFLYNMVRIIAGTAMSAARGRLDAAGVAAILASGRRSLLCSTAPAEGLYLTRVEYHFEGTDCHQK